MCLFASPSKRFIGIAPSSEHWKEESYERGCGVGGLLVGFEDLSVRRENCCISIVTGQSRDCY